ncbi:MAG: hypothetical protein KDC92_03585 [Bacteroidetes bacterium]|nr:hypothetical protein [Bacteroidota bacterium]
MPITTTTTSPNQHETRHKVIRVLQEFTKSSPMGSITTGMLSLLIKPKCGAQEFENLLESLQREGSIIGIPKGKTKRWKIDWVREAS